MSFDVQMRRCTKARRKCGGPATSAGQWRSIGSPVTTALLSVNALWNDELLSSPTPRVVLYGTKERPYTAPSTGAADLNWAALAQCESGGNPRAVNPAGYYGLYQFALSTWYSVGGTGNPIDASADEQTYRAQVLYSRSGASPWPVCGPLLFS